VPCARLSWPTRQLLSRRKYTASYRIVQTIVFFELIFFNFCSWSYDKKDKACLFVLFKFDVPRLNCQHSGFTLVLTFQPQDITFEYHTRMHALSVYCQHCHCGFSKKRQLCGLNDQWRTD